MTPERLLQLADRPATDLPLERLGLDLPSAAVLLLVWADGDDQQLLLTRRAARLRTQPGDIALPGGRSNPGETPTETAVREAHEEVGLDPAAIDVVGRLDEAWSSAGSRVVPVVARAEVAPSLAPSPAEVAEIIVVSLADLADPRHRHERVTPAGEHTYRDAVITLDDVVVIGFTADLVLDLVSWLQGGDRRRIDERMADLAQFAHDRGWIGRAGQSGASR